MRDATGLTGYKHTEEAKLKIINRFKYKTNHLLWVKHGYENYKNLISKLGVFNSI